MTCCGLIFSCSCSCYLLAGVHYIPRNCAELHKIVSFVQNHIHTEPSSVLSFLNDGLYASFLTWHRGPFLGKEKFCTVVNIASVQQNPLVGASCDAYF